MPKIALAAAILIFIAAPALAYNKPTHMISAAVAYHALKAEAPEALQKIIALLKQHPDYGKFKLDAVAAEDRDLLLFMASCQNNLFNLSCSAMISPTSEWSNLLRARRHVGGLGCFGEIR